MNRTKAIASRNGEWVSTDSPDKAAVRIGQDELGLTMQRSDRYKRGGGKNPLGM